MRTYICEADYRDQMEQLVQPFLDARAEDGFFPGYDGNPLHYCLYRADAPRGTVTIVHGFTECIPKYREFIYMMLCDGLNVCIYEHRGHGKSYRVVENLQYTHIDRFDEYIDDLDCFVTQLVTSLPGPHYLFSHSMGGGIAALYLERGGTFFQKAVLSSPMVAPNRGKYPLWLCKLIFGGAVLLGKKHERVFTYPAERGTPAWIEANDNSEVRWRFNENNKQEHPEYQNFAATYGWLNASIKVTERILAKGEPESIVTPTRLYRASLDTYVSVDMIERFAARIPGAELMRIEDSTHTLFMCKDSVTHPYYDSLLDYFS